MSHSPSGPRSVTGHRLVSSLSALIAVIILMGLASLSVSAHAELVRSTPANGAIEPTSPAQVELWFSEALDPSASSAAVYDAQRQEVDAGNSKVDPNNHEHMTVGLKHLGNGTYTVAWRSRSADDGHQTQGSFTFQVGVSRFPGAASTVNQSPSWPAVALRWIGLLGLMAGAGWFLLSLLGAGADDLRWWLALGGVALAIVADLLLVPVQAYWPGGGLPAQSLGAALAAMPRGWQGRLILEGALLLIVAWTIKRGFDRLAMVAGLVVAAAAVFTLTLTSHAAARTNDRVSAMAANALHIETVVFWLGGLMQLAVAPAPRQVGCGKTLGRFSRLAIYLAPLAIVTGIINAGLTLPTFDSLWQSRYGDVLIAKLVLVIGILGVAYVNRRRVWEGLQRLGQIARSLRLEFSIAGLAILAAALLAFTAPPVPKQQQPLRLRADVAQNVAVHLQLNPPDSAHDDIEVWLSDKNNQPLSGVNAADVSFSMLERQVDISNLSPTLASDGHWRLENVPLTIKGWWEIDVQLSRSDAQPAQATFYVLLPDPTRIGPDRARTTDPQAREIYKAAIKEITELKSMKQQQSLSDGVGNSVNTTFSYAAPNKLEYTTESGDKSIAIGDKQYYLQGGKWLAEQRVDPYSFPAGVPGYYSGATAITLGRTQVVDGEECQIITFDVPAISGSRDEAWYAWWVGTKSHQVRREAMVARYHYMINDNSAFNAPLSITAPKNATPESP